MKYFFQVATILWFIFATVSIGKSQEQTDEALRNMWTMMILANVWGLNDKK